jgi:hypothetical protein
MPGQAHVTSIPALDDFRAKLVVYLSKAGRVLDDVRQEVVGTRIWLQTNRQLHWKSKLKKRRHQLSRAEAELLSARLSGHPSVIQERRMTVQRARAAVAEAEEAVARVKSWLRNYETQVESRLKAVNQLRQVLTQDMKKAVIFLETAGDTLAEYANLASAGASAPADHNRSSPSQASSASEAESDQNLQSRSPEAT